MQDGEWTKPIHFGVERSKVKATMNLCQHFGSDTINVVVFNAQLSYFIHRCRVARGRYLYMLGSKGLRSRSQLCQHFGSDMIT